MRIAIWGLLTFVAAVSIVLAWAIWTVEPQTTVQPQFNWSQQVLRSLDADSCRAQDRIPQFVDMDGELVYLECMPVRR